MRPKPMWSSNSAVAYTLSKRADAFQILKGKQARTNSLVDDNLLCFIRRMNLDAFWSREPFTVTGNRTQLRKGLRLTEQFDVQSPYPDLGPFPVADEVGYGVAL
jgi:hypothetical protein